MTSTDTSSEPVEELGSRLLTRVGVGASVLVHIAVMVWLVFGTGVRLFQSPPAEEAIAVELVTPQEAEPKKDETEEKKKKDTLTQLDLTIPEPSLSDSAIKTPQAAAATKQEPPSPAKQPAQQQQAAAKPSPPQPAPPQPPAPSDPLAAATQPAPSSPPAPAPQQPMASFAVNAPPVAQPDITEKYGTMFNLSDTGYSGDTMAAKIEASAVDTFRAHLRKCSQMPPNITATDKVKIVLRVALTPSGNLISAPALIEASASPKGPYLMQAAIKALQACQPYDMLPADKYKEWRVLDLSFSPKDFGAG
ncbi:MAG TPA: hypothetical protein VGC26_10415 [Afipia sp.]